MSVRHATVAVGTTATSLTVGYVTDRDQYGSVLLTNDGAASVYVGGSDVTTSVYGYELAVGGELALDLDPGDVPYGVAASAGQTVRVLYTRV